MGVARGAVEVTVLTHRGAVRQANEDAVVMGALTVAGLTLFSDAAILRCTAGCPSLIPSSSRSPTVWEATPPVRSPRSTRSTGWRRVAPS